jgi:anti-sigma factor ChrR (cupin superfamily)
MHCQNNLLSATLLRESRFLLLPLDFRMLINHDFNRRVTIAREEYEWVNSPQAGVDRVMLDRLGEEVARATSVVRYLPETPFPFHRHPGGEEILVLAGQFSEGDNDYPAGWYLRNPPGSSHQPHSQNGTLIFVKLGQMNSGVQPRVRINTRDAANWHEKDGIKMCPLFENEHENTHLLRLTTGTLLFEPALSGGVELFVLGGSLIEGNGIHGEGSWLRVPVTQPLVCSAGSDDTLLYIKKGISQPCRKPHNVKNTGGYCRRGIKWFICRQSAGASQYQLSLAGRQGVCWWSHPAGGQYRGGFGGYLDLACCSA